MNVMESHAKPQSRKKSDWRTGLTRGWEFVVKSIGHAFDPVLNQALTEIDPYPKFQPCYSKASKKLLRMNGVHRLHRLEFKNDQITNNEVSSESLIKADGAPLDRHRHLPFDAETRIPQLMRVCRPFNIDLCVFAPLRETPQ